MNDLSVHPMGAAKKQPESDCRALVPAEGPMVLDTFSGRVHVEWDPSAAVTPLGQLAFFTEYLKVGDLFEPWVEQCPVSWTSNNAPNKRDVLGTAVLSILCGHQRYARQRRLITSHHHADAPWVERSCRNLAVFLHGLRLTAEQLTPTQRWYQILSRALRNYLHGRQLQPPDPLPAPT